MNVTDSITAVSTLAIALFALMQIIVLAQQRKAMGEQVAAMVRQEGLSRQTYMATERPWLSYYQPEFDWNGNTISEYAMAIANSGKTPGYVLTSGIAIIKALDPPRAGEVLRKLRSKRSGGAVAPGGKIIHGGPPEGIFNLQENLYCVASIRYRDLFGRIHTTSMIWRKRPMHRAFIFEYAPKYNRYT